MAPVFLRSLSAAGRNGGGARACSREKGASEHGASKLAAYGWDGACKQAGYRGNGASKLAAYRSGDGRGFTVLEVLLVIAVIGLLTSVLVVGGARMFDDQPVAPEEVFWRAVEDARRSALLGQVEVRMSYDAEERGFRLRGPNSGSFFPIAAERELHVDLLSMQPSATSILIGGVLVENQPLPFVTFFEDGTCTPFRVQIRTTGEVETLGVDPWTCAPVLAATPSTP